VSQIAFSKCWHRLKTPWKLTVNTNKTKIVVFSKKKYKTNVVFKIYGQAIDLQELQCHLHKVL
jgi:hypothetical protein